MGNSFCNESKFLTISIEIVFYYETVCMIYAYRAIAALDHQQHHSLIWLIFLKLHLNHQSQSQVRISLLISVERQVRQLYLHILSYNFVSIFNAWWCSNNFVENILYYFNEFQLDNCSEHYNWVHWRAAQPVLLGWE